MNGTEKLNEEVLNVSFSQILVRTDNLKQIGVARRENQIYLIKLNKCDVEFNNIHNIGAIHQVMQGSNFSKYTSRQDFTSKETTHLFDGDMATRITIVRQSNTSI